MPNTNAAAVAWTDGDVEGFELGIAGWRGGEETWGVRASDADARARRVLVVHEARSACLGVADVMAEAGFHVEWTTECGRATGRLDDQAYDLVIMDARLRRTGGDARALSRTIDDRRQATIALGLLPDGSTHIEAISQGMRLFVHARGRDSVGRIARLMLPETTQAA